MEQRSCWWAPSLWLFSNSVWCLPGQQTVYSDLMACNASDLIIEWVHCRCGWSIILTRTVRRWSLYQHWSNYWQGSYAKLQGKNTMIKGLDGVHCSAESVLLSGVSLSGVSNSSASDWTSHLCVYDYQDSVGLVSKKAFEAVVRPALLHWGSTQYRDHATSLTLPVRMNKILLHQYNYEHFAMYAF
jgi:hypothetical protein